MRSGYWIEVKQFALNRTDRFGVTARRMLWGFAIFRLPKSRKTINKSFLLLRDRNFWSAFFSLTEP